MRVEKQEAKVLLQKNAYNGKSYAQNIHDLWWEAHDKTINSIGMDRHIHGPSVFAHLMWSYMIYGIKRFVVADSEVNPTTSFDSHNKMNLLKIGKKLAIRFKKLDKKLNTSNNVTDQVKDFKLQRLEFDDQTTMTCVDAGYRLNALGTSIEEIFFVCPDGLINHFWKLATYDLEIANPQVALFEVQEEDVLPVVRVKPQIKKVDERDAG